MLTIRHRVNEIQMLIDTPKDMGVEIDIRTLGGELILSHDPFIKGPRLKDWIKNYDHKHLILNTKEDGLEDLLIDMLKERDIVDFFFLDQPFPTVRKTIKNGCSKIALRFSEFESLSFLQNMAGQCDWVWIDSFDTYSHDLDALIKIKEMGFKLCFVSPELQGRYCAEERAAILAVCAKLNADAVCTKIYG